MGEFPSLVWEVLVKYFQKTVDILNQRLYNRANATVIEASIKSAKKLGITYDRAIPTPIITVDKAAPKSIQTSTFIDCLTGCVSLVQLRSGFLRLRFKPKHPIMKMKEVIKIPPKSMDRKSILRTIPSVIMEITPTGAETSVCKVSFAKSTS